MERARQFFWSGSGVLHIGSIWITSADVIMTTHTPTPGVLETVITDDSLLKKDVSTHASHDKDVPAVSKQVMKVYRRAMKASKARDAKSRQICAALRAKREGTEIPVEPAIREEPTAKVQTLLSDF